MNFKESIITDNASVFMSLEEFGEEVTINKLPATVIIDDEELERRNLAKSNNSDVDRLAKSDLLFYIQRDFFDHIPQANKFIDFNNKKYRIDTVSNEMGILTIVASRYTG